MEQDDPWLDDLAAAILEGTAVESLAVDADRNSPQAAAIRQAKIVAQIAELHRHSPYIASDDNLSATDSAVPLTPWGRLTILEELGRGAFGVVYRARDPRLDRDVALKLLLSHADAGAAGLAASVIDEGRRLARVHHPNVVVIYDADLIGGRVGLTMELVHGQTLEQVLEDRGILSTAEVTRIGVVVCRALAAVHHAGLLHRDVKAQNIMRQADGRLVLMDFGTGRELDEPPDERGLSRASLTPASVTSRVAGTPHYAAPELFEGRPATIESDVYSVGVLLYHLLTRSYPITGATVRELRDAHRDGGTVALRDERPDVPPRLAGVIERALAPDPHGRYPSADEMAEALEALAAPSSMRKQGLGVETPVVVGGLVVVGLLVMSGVYITQSGGRWLGPSQASESVARVDYARSGAGADTTAPDSALGSPQPAALRFQGRDWVLIAAFENKTGEAVLDGTLEYALERELSNSPFVNVAPRERIDDVLQLMQRPKDARVDVRLGREICLRDGGIRVLLSGRVERIGTAYVVTSQIVNPADGVVLKSLAEDAGQQTALLQAIRRLAFRVRETLGEMIATIQTSQIALDKVTTPSLHALQLYSQASAFLHGENWKDDAAEPLLKQAIAEDSRFASAYILLAHAIHNQGRPKEDYIPYASRAAALASQTSDVERYFILGSYHGLVADTGDSTESHRRQAIAAYEALLQLKPDHYWGVVNLASDLDKLKQDADTAAAFARAAAVRPQNMFLSVRASFLMRLNGNPAAAQYHMKQAEAGASLSDYTRHFFGIFLAQHALMGWDALTARQIADALGRRLASVNGTSSELGAIWGSLTLTYLDLGRFHDAQQVMQSAPVGSMVHPGYYEFVGWAPLMVRSPGAKDSFRDFLAARFKSDQRLVLDRAAFFAHYFYEAGMMEELRQLAEKSQQPERRTPMSVIHEINGHIALAEGRVEDAAQDFEAARSAGFTDGFARRRLALTMADAWKEADHRAQASRLLERETSAWLREASEGGNLTFWIPARDRLADLYQSMGQTENARTIDAELMKLLAVADDDHPVLAHIKARQAKGGH